MRNKTWKIFPYGCRHYFWVVHQPKIQGRLNEDLIANFTYSLSLNKRKIKSDGQIYFNRLGLICFLQVWTNNQLKLDKLSFIWYLLLSNQCYNVLTFHCNYFPIITEPKVYYYNTRYHKSNLLLLFTLLLLGKRQCV